MSKTENIYDKHEQGNLSLGGIIPCLSKDQVIKIVADFGMKYDTGRFLGSCGTLEEAIEEVKDLIDWDIVNKK